MRPLRRAVTTFTVTLCSLATAAFFFADNASARYAPEPPIQSNAALVPPPAVTTTTGGTSIWWFVLVALVSVVATLVVIAGVRAARGWARSADSAVAPGR